VVTAYAIAHAFRAALKHHSMLLAGADLAFKPAQAFSLRRPWPVQQRGTEGRCV